MADLVITASTVKPGSDAEIRSGMAGETIIQGKVVYYNTTTNKVMLADSNAAGAEARRPLGIALNSANLDQPVSFQVAGDITIGAAVTNGVIYYLTETPGGLGTQTDLSAGEYPVIVGMGKSTTVIRIGIVVSPVVL